jgi:hypothetical protein
MSAVRATIHYAFRLDSVPDDLAFTMSTDQGHGMNSAFETVEDMCLPRDLDLKGLIVIISAHLTFCHMCLRYEQLRLRDYYQLFSFHMW